MKAATTTKIALAYGRVSTPGQEDNTSKDNQQKTCRELAERQGYTIEGEYFDVYSGAQLNRSELNKLRDRIREGGIAAVLCYDPDRLSRKLSHAYVLEEFFEKHNVELLFVHAPTSKIDAHIKKLLSEIERETIADRLSTGKRNRLLQGSILGKRTMAFGYDHARVPDPRYKGGRGILLENEAEAYWVVQIFTWAAQGVPTTQIARRLHEAGVPTKKGGLWQRTTIRDMLRNPAYMGQYAANRTQNVAPEHPQDSYEETKQPKRERSSTKRRDETEWIKIPCPALVSEELWQAANEQVKLNKRDSVHTPKYQYLLRGMVFCAECLHRMSARKGSHPSKPNFYYLCQHKAYYTAVCGVRPQRIDRLERDVWEGIVTRLRNPDIIREGVERHARQAGRNQERDESDLVAIAATLKKLAADEARLLEQYLDNVFSKEVVQGKAEAIKKERAGLEREYAEVQARVEARAVATAHLHVLESLSEAVGEELDYLPFDAKRGVLEALQTRITVYKEGPPMVECLLTEAAVSLLEWTCENAHTPDAPAEPVSYLTIQSTGCLQ